MEHMPIFLDVLASDSHQWSKLGSLGPMVDAPLGEGGYKEVFKKERIVGLMLFGKQRKTVSDIMKRVGIKNVKHRDLLVESIFDLSKPQPPQTDEEVMAAKFALVRNTWSNERNPAIQLEAMSDVLASSADEAQHSLLKQFDVLALLLEIIDSNMMDAELERDLAARQSEVDELWKQRRKRQLDYEQKKELDRKEHLLAKDWIQWKADFGSLAVVAFASLQNLSKSSVFSKDIAAGEFPDRIMLQLERCLDAEKRLTLLKALSKGQYMTLVASEIADTQLMCLNIICHLSLEPDNRALICNRGICAAVVKVANSPSVRDSPLYDQCLRIFCNLSIGGGETEARMVTDGVLGPVTSTIREGVRENILFAISTVTNLAFVEENRDPLIDSGVLIPLTKILREEKEETLEKLKAIDALRNFAAARADLRFAKIVVDELMEIVRNGKAEERLRSLIALRSITRHEETLQICEEQGVVRQALSFISHEDNRLRIQCIGLLINVIGFSAIVPMDADEEDETSDSELLSDADEEPASRQESRPSTSENRPKTSQIGEEETTRVDDQLHEIKSSESRPETAGWSTLQEPERLKTGELLGAERPLKRANKLLKMRVSPLFRLLQERELELIALRSEYFTVSKGQALVVQGDSMDSIYVVIKGIVRVLIGADHSSARKWSMHRISRNRPSAVKGIMPGDTSPGTGSGDHSPSSVVSPLVGSDSVSPAGGESPEPGSPAADRLRKRGRAEKGGKTEKSGATFRAGKNTREVARLRPGDTANELCVMEGRKSLATLVSMTEDTVIMDITPKILAEQLMQRSEFTDALSAGESVMLHDIEKVRRIWKHPALSDEAAEKANLFRIESSERRAKIQRHLLAIGAVEVFERSVKEETKLLTKVMFQIGLTLLIGGPEKKESPLLVVDEDIIEQIKCIIQCSRDGEEFYGHYYDCSKVLLCMRLLAMNDANKRKFVQCAIIPFVLDLLKDSDLEIVRLAVAILLELSFGMQARWLLRPILGIWNKYVRSAKEEREIAAIPPPLTDTIDIAAPTHLVQVRGIEAEPTFSHELHEACYEGGQQWIERLVEEDGVEADIRDGNGATGMHFAAVNARLEAIGYLMDRDVDINVVDVSGCSPLAWYIMARNVEFGTDQDKWPAQCNKVVEWMSSQGALALFCPMFANTV